MVLSAAGCRHEKDSDGADQPAALALVLVDISKSTFGKGGERRDRYAADFKRVLAGIPGGTLVRGDQIDANPLSGASLPISGFIAGYGGVFGDKTKFQVNQENAAAIEQIEQQFARLLTRRPVGNSILGALNIAQDVFQAYPDVSTKYLVIFSDMIENSPRYKFTNANLAPAEVEAFVAKEREREELPDLDGVEIYIIGAGGTRGSDTNPARLVAVKRFWLTYFDAAGASLPSHRYSPTLIRFP